MIDAKEWLESRGLATEREEKPFIAGDIVEHDGSIWRFVKKGNLFGDLERFLPYGRLEKKNADLDDVEFVQHAPEDRVEAYRLIGLDISDPRAAAIAEKDGENPDDFMKQFEKRGEIARLSNAWELEESGLEAGDIVEYKGKNWVLEINRDGSARLKGVDGYFRAYEKAGFSEVKRVMSRPEDPEELARVLGMDEELLGVKVEFECSRDTDWFDDEDFDGEEQEYTDEIDDVWSAGIDWNTYASNYMRGKTPDSISYVNFVKNGKCVSVETCDLFSEYEWESIVDGYKEAVKDGRDSIQV